MGVKHLLVCSGTCVCVFVCVPAWCVYWIMYEFWLSSDLFSQFVNPFQMSLRGRRFSLSQIQHVKRLK